LIEAGEEVRPDVSKIASYARAVSRLSRESLVARGPGFVRGAEPIGDLILLEAGALAVGL
jgi:hypothetical protein